MGNAVWLSPDKSTPYALYQYMINTADPDVEKMLKMLTFIELPEIEATMRLHNVCVKCIIAPWEFLSPSLILAVIFCGIL